MYNGQMELSFEIGNPCTSGKRRQRRISRAQWWFERMREVVERAVDRSPRCQARPEQMVFSGAHRLPLAASITARDRSIRSPHEQEVCE
jgi:hypothetical protein